MWVLDGSIRRRSLDLLYGMCDVSNAKEIVEELLQVRHEFSFKVNLRIYVHSTIMHDHSDDFE